MDPGFHSTDKEVLEAHGFEFSKKYLQDIEASSDSPSRFLGDGYFKELVVASTDVNQLQHVRLKLDKGRAFVVDARNTSESLLAEDTIPFFACARRGGPIKASDVASVEGIPLTIRIFEEMTRNHLDAELRHEMVTILENGTTSQEQMARIATLLRRFSKDPTA